jgi:hypothetical protein
MALQSNAHLRLLMDFSQPALIFDFSVYYLILYLLISVCTPFHHLFFGRLLSRHPWGLLSNTWLTHVNYLNISFNRQLTQAAGVTLQAARVPHCVNPEPVFEVKAKVKVKTTQSTCLQYYFFREQWNIFH